MNDDRAMSVEALLGGLQDIRLPVSAPGGTLAEVLAALALACLGALLVSGLLRLVSRRRVRATVPSLASELQLLATRTEAERRVALLHLLKRHAPERFAALRGALYRPGSDLDTSQLEAELRRHV